MSNTSTVSVTAATLEVPGARLYYEVRGAGPFVALVGAPMDAAVLRAAGRPAGRGPHGAHDRPARYPPQPPG